MPHDGIHGFASTSCMPATPSSKCWRMARETANSISAATRPTTLISAAKRRGTSISRTAVTIGSQRTSERTWLIVWPQGAGRRARGAGGVLATARLSATGMDSCGCRTTTCAPRPPPCALSCQHPYEHHHSRKKHQRVVAHVAGLQEAQQIAGGVDCVAEEREGAVDDRVDAAPEEDRDPLQRPHDGDVVDLIDIPLVLERRRQSLRQPAVAGELRVFESSPRDPPAEEGDERGDGGDRDLRRQRDLDDAARLFDVRDDGMEPRLQQVHRPVAEDLRDADEAADEREDAEDP